MKTSTFDIRYWILDIVVEQDHETISNIEPACRSSDFAELWRVYPPCSLAGRQAPNVERKRRLTHRHDPSVQEIERKRFFRRLLVQILRYFFKPCRDLHDLLLRFSPGFIQSRQHFDIPEFNEFVGYLLIVPGTVDADAPNDISHLFEMRHVQAGHFK